jgi:Fungal specific transcription factor domain
MQYPDFKIFLSDPTVRSNALSKVRQEAESIRKRVRTEKKLGPISTVVGLFELFPNKDSVNQAVGLYWDLMESTYRVLHRPTFTSQYQAFWQNPTNADESFTAIILLIMSIVRCLKPRLSAENTYHGLSSTGREQAMEWIEACENWLNRQSRKHLTIEAFQTRILLYLAKQVNCIKSKQLWENATALLNFGLATGLHQDPSKIDKILVNEKPGTGPHKQQNSAYEREMRRRIWATMVELELQVSFDRGLPSSRTVLIADCGVPSNLNDEEFGSDSPSLPGPEPRESYTASSYLRLSNESLQLRVTLNDLINNTSARLSYDDLLSYDERLTQALESLPKWVQSAQESESTSMVPAVLLDIQLRQFQLSLHIPFARQVGTNPRYKYSKMMCVNNANRILELHLKLAQNGRHTLNVLRDDVFRASMAMCHNMVLWGSLKSKLLSHLTQA